MPALALTQSSSSSASPELTATLIKRYYCYGYNCNYGNSNWGSWGRWVTLGCVVGAALLLFFCCSCLSARRRRKTGSQPFYGTGWLAGNHGPVQYYGDQNAANTQGMQPPVEQQTTYYNNNNNNYNNNATVPQQEYAAPAYEPTPNTTGYYGQNSAYGQQQSSGIELQQPVNSYQPAGYKAEGEVFQPPAGPPPGRTTY